MDSPHSRNPFPVALHRYVIALGVTTVLLIWWGAATTTKQAGMAFADWPLSLGSINPPGWLDYMVPFLEHSHRLLATIVGFMTLILFAWSFRRDGGRFLELIGLVLWLAFTFALFIKAGAERQSAERKSLLLLWGCLAGVLPVLWLGISWARRKRWTSVTRFSGLALLLVTSQAILGGLRVTEISDTFAVIHGCLAQGFFCLVILIAFLTSPRWKDRKDALVESQRRPLRWISSLLVFSIVGQLILGALMRHHHRSGLADTGIFLTGGRWFPAWGGEISGGDPWILLLMFAHKYWALVVFGLSLGVGAWLWSRRDVPVGLLRHSLVIVGLLVVQILLGVSVLLTGSPEHKRFWVTNFHVLNGLAILATAFALTVRCWSARSRQTLLASDSDSRSTEQAAETRGVALP